MNLQNLKNPKILYKGIRKKIFGNRKPKIEKVIRKQSARRPEKFLMIAYFDPNGLGTIKDNVLLWAQGSRFNFDLINLYLGEYSNGLALPVDLDLRKYDGIVIHCTVAYNIYNLISLDSQLKSKFEDYNGIKIIMKQDEHYKPHLVSKYISDKGFNIVITVAPQGIIPILYPYQKESGVEFIPTYTGFISDEMLKWKFPLERSMDIVYRGSLQPHIFGRLGYEKKWIGDQFHLACEKYGLKHDISSRWEDRIFGDNWFKFLGSSKGTVGVESGASIVDFSGEIEVEYKKFIEKNKNPDFEYVFDHFLKRYEGNAQYRAIAPRHFEAIVSKTAQLLVKGSYSGVLKENIHYFSLEPDLSNLEDIIKRFKDPLERKRIVLTAYEEIALNKKYQYASFIENIDQRIEEKIDRL